ncbi:MAG: hypothetical protein WDN24_12180 [Sphingomonas sp.]
MSRGVARVLLKKNPHVLRHAKSAFKFVESLDWDTSEAMLGALAVAAGSSDPERGRRSGMTQFLDEKSYRPGARDLSSLGPTHGHDCQPRPACGRLRAASALGRGHRRLRDAGIRRAERDPQPDLRRLQGRHPCSEPQRCPRSKASPR